MKTSNNVYPTRLYKSEEIGTLDVVDICNMLNTLYRQHQRDLTIRAKQLLKQKLIRQMISNDPNLKSQLEDLMDE